MHALAMPKNIARWLALIVAALVGADALIAAVGRRRGWTRPVAWLGPVLTVGAATLMTVVLVPNRAIPPAPGTAELADVVLGRLSDLDPAAVEPARTPARSEARTEARRG